jgi:hypothetical protein
MLVDCDLNYKIPNIITEFVPSTKDDADWTKKWIVNPNRQVD